MLNSDQSRVLENVRDHLLHQLKHEDNQCTCDDMKPLCMFVSGVGGTGKSFLIETIKMLVNDMWPIENLTCAVAAPTGLAAFNVGLFIDSSSYRLNTKEKLLVTGHCQKILKKS